MLAKSNVASILAQTEMVLLHAEDCSFIRIPPDNSFDTEGA